MLNTSQSCIKHGPATVGLSVLAIYLCRAEHCIYIYSYMGPYNTVIALYRKALKGATQHSVRYLVLSLSASHPYPWHINRVTTMNSTETAPSLHLQGEALLQRCNFKFTHRPHSSPLQVGALGGEMLGPVYALYRATSPSCDALDPSHILS